MLVVPLNGAVTITGRGFGLANLMITKITIPITIGNPTANPMISPVFEPVDVAPPAAAAENEQLLPS